MLNTTDEYLYVNVELSIKAKSVNSLLKSVVGQHERRIESSVKMDKEENILPALF